MIGATIMHPRQPGPCVICGGTDYDLSCGGPTICPKCDCGNFDSATVMKQAKVIADLRKQIQTLTVPAQGSWMPIETAPMDTNVLMAWLYDGIWEIKSGWAGSTKGGYLHSQATHWMPLAGAPSVPSTMRRGPCQCCSEVTELSCGPSRFGPETWACAGCWGGPVPRPNSRGTEKTDGSQS